MGHHAPAFVIGGGINGLGVVQSLGRCGIDVHIFDHAMDDIAYHSRFAKTIILSAPDDVDYVINQLLSCAEQYDKKPVLFFASDRYIKLLMSAKETIEDNFVSKLNHAEAVDIVVDKEKFMRFCERYNFPAPKTYHPQSTKELEALCKHLAFPAILKPSLSHQWENPIRGNYMKILKVTEQKELIASWLELRDTCDKLLVQEFIPGEDSDHYSYCAYRSRAGAYIGICVRKLRLYPIHGGSSTLLEVVRYPELERIGQYILSVLGIPGTASVCFKRDTTTGKPKIFEINGRLPYWHVASQMCGLNLPYIMYLDYLGKTTDTVQYNNQGAKWVSLTQDLWSYAALRQANELGFWQWIASYRGVKSCSEFARDDIGPFFFYLRRLATMIARKIARFVRY